MATETNWADALYIVQTKNGDSFQVTVSGRDKWALETLNLRGIGIPIETHTETHTGPFSGTHARYELLATVRRYVSEAAA
jgi:hypothetical protein